MLTSLISQNDCIWMSGCHAVEREALDVMDAIASPPARQPGPHDRNLLSSFPPVPLLRPVGWMSWRMWPIVRLQEWRSERLSSKLARGVCRSRRAKACRAVLACPLCAGD